MFGFLLGKELENGDIKYGLSYIDSSMDSNKRGLLRKLDSMLSKDRPAMLQKNMPLRVVSKDIYLGDFSKMRGYVGVEQMMCSKIRYYLSKEGILYCYNTVQGTLNIVN